MRKIAMSLGMIAFVGAVVVGGTGAFFSDTESSTGNVFTAGEIDLLIDNSSYGFDWNNPDVQNPQGEWGPNADNTWDLRNLDECGEGDDQSCIFFDFHDLKPGDYGEDTISLHVQNDAWACMTLDVTGTPENTINEPEEDAGDVTDDPDGGELQNYLSFAFWEDDGDNVYEDNEGPLLFNGFLSELDGVEHAIADSLGGGSPLEADVDYFVGKFWCFGEITPTPVTPDDYDAPTADNTGFSCTHLNPEDNVAQTDGVVVDVSFRAEQHRHNDNFVCREGDGGPIGCNEEADVMLVLDSSGSIGGDLTTLQDAAKAFVTSLSPSADGVHVGVVDFDGDGTLEQGLTDNVTDIETAIDNLASGGSTNLEEGIRTGQQELADNGRGGVPKYMVIITDGDPTAQDGNPNDGDGTDAGEAEDAASDAKGAGTEIFAVGVGSDLDATYLQDNIVSSPSGTHYFDAANFEALEDILEELTMCPDDQPNPPIIEPGYSGLTEAAGARWKGENSGNEVYLGVPDLGVGGNRNEEGKDWTTDGTHSVSFSWDAVENSLTTVVDGNDLVYDFDVESVGPTCLPADWDVMDILLKDPADDGATPNVEFQNIELGGFPLGDLAHTSTTDSGQRFQNWTVSNFDFTNSFTITGDLVIDGDWANNEDTVVQVIVGCAP